jgi:DNA-binding transcriptional regulator of glucitol operon
VGYRKLSSTDKVKDEEKRDYLGIAIFSGICVTAAALGTWQVKRYTFAMPHAL